MASTILSPPDATTGLANILNAGCQKLKNGENSSIYRIRFTRIRRMELYQKTLEVRTAGKGTREITRELEKALDESGLTAGMLTVFCCHTSCSLVIMENADPSARVDLEAWLERLVPERDALFTHTFEGADDMPSHIKMALTRTSESIPFANGQLALGTWQGCFLWEHRSTPHRRQLEITLIGR
jgi:secondary thiamine-phosphate synthase enzyme